MVESTHPSINIMLKSVFACYIQVRLLRRTNCYFNTVIQVKQVGFYEITTNLPGTCSQWYRLIQVIRVELPRLK